MVFKTVSTVYHVISCEQTEGDVKRFLCRDGRNERCMLFQVCEAEDFSGVIRYFTELSQNRKFRDFKECFVQDGSFFLVMAHGDGQRLAVMLEREKMSVAERLELGAKLLEKLILLDMPYYIMSEVMDSNYITFTEDGKVGFLYRFFEISECVCNKKREAMEKLADVFSELFAKELGYEVVPPLKKFLSRVRGAVFENLTELYREYLDMAELVRKIPEEELKKPKNKWFLYWEQIKAWAQKWKKAALLFLLLFVLFYVCVNIYQYLRPKGEEKVFETIGTVTVVK